MQGRKLNFLILTIKSQSKNVYLLWLSSILLYVVKKKYVQNCRISVIFFYKFSYSVKLKELQNKIIFSCFFVMDLIVKCFIQKNAQSNNKYWSWKSVTSIEKKLCFTAQFCIFIFMVEHQSLLVASNFTHCILNL